jgi:hypothetical protein
MLLPQLPCLLLKFASTKLKIIKNTIIILNLLEPLSGYPRFGAIPQTRRWILPDWLSFQFFIRVVKSRVVRPKTVSVN